jgi:hypothetical protein
MKKFAYVLAQAFNRTTGDAVGTPRVEQIDLKTNKLFSFAETPLQIKQVYESFWNEMNTKQLTPEVVFVQQVSFKPFEFKKRPRLSLYEILRTQTYIVFVTTDLHDPQVYEATGTELIAYLREALDPEGDGPADEIEFLAWANDVNGEGKTFIQVIQK